MNSRTDAFEALETVDQPSVFVVGEHSPIWIADVLEGSNDEAEMNSEELIVGWSMLQMYGQQMLSADESFAIIPRKTLPERLASMLLELAKEKEGVINDINFRELASVLDTHRETVASVLRAFRRQGLIDFSYRRILILNPGSLHEIGGEPDLSVIQ